MKKFGFAAVAASGLVAAILGLAAPAYADNHVTEPIVPAADNAPRGVDSHMWFDVIRPDDTEALGASGLHVGN